MNALKITNMNLNKIKEQDRKRRDKIMQSYNKTQKLGKSWNPLPKREDIGKSSRLHSTVDSRAGFINCTQGYFNVGKFKGVQIKDVPISYLIWVANQIQLNPSELNVLRKVIKYKERK